jgi:hypothetical protein
LQILLQNMPFEYARKYFALLTIIKENSPTLELFVKSGD